MSSRISWLWKKPGLGSVFRFRDVKSAKSHHFPLANLAAGVFRAFDFGAGMNYTTLWYSHLPEKSRRK